MLRIWGRRNSLNVQKVMWLVGELGLAHEHVEAGGPFGRLDEPGFLAMNPHGRVPVLEAEGAAIWESHTILRYLAARHGGARFWPADPLARSRTDRWMDWALASLQPAFMAVFWGFHRTPPARRDWAAIRNGLERCARCYGLLDRELAGRPYLAGDRLTLADLPAGATLHRYFGMEIERPDLPAVEAWYRRLAGHPAYRAHVMLPFEELRGRLDY